MVCWDSRCSKTEDHFYKFFAVWEFLIQMDPVKHSAVTPSKSRFARSLAKILNIKSLTEKSKPHEKSNKDENNPSFDDEDEELHNMRVKEAFLAKLFASISSIKAAYAQLQFAQYPYDTNVIQSSDQIVVSELKNLSELKLCYVKNQLNEISPETSLTLSEIQEHSSLVKIYDITSKKLDSQIKLKESEITFLKEKLAEMNKDNKSLEKRQNSSGQISMPENTQLSSLKPSHFIAYLRHAVKSIRSFVRLMISEMESADWDLEVAASSIVPGVRFQNPNHKCFAFESYVCKKMFDGFDFPNFSNKSDTFPDQEIHRRSFYDAFMELKSVRPADYIAWKPKSTFATFCRDKYSKLVHPKMEASLFGNLDTNDFANLGDLPETPFFLVFGEMVKRVWLLHCLAFSFDPEVSIFQVGKGALFSEVYMESVNDEAFLSFDVEHETGQRVGFMVVPGFRVGKTVVQCQVYLCWL